MTTPQGIVKGRDLDCHQQGRIGATGAREVQKIPPGTAPLTMIKSMQIPVIFKHLSRRSGRQALGDRFWSLAAAEEKRLYRLAFRYTGNQYDAEDLAQETLLAAYRSFYQLRDPKRFRGWLFAILRNAFLKKKRSERMRTAPLEEDGRDYLEVLEAAASQYNAEELYAKVSESRQVQESVAGLPEKYQTVILLRFTEGMTYQEIANALGIPLGTVMSRLSRGKQMLKRKLLKQALGDGR